MERTGPSVGVAVWIAGTDEQLWDKQFERARAAAAEHVELRLAYPPGNGALRERQLRRIRHHLQGVRLLAHAPATWESLITAHDGLFELSLLELQATVKVAHELGAEALIIAGGPLYFQGIFSRPPELRERLHAALVRLLPQAQELGLQLALENRSAGYPASAAELQEILNSTEMKAALDLGELPPDRAQEPVAALELLFPQLLAVRLPAELPEARQADPLAYLRGAGFADFLTLYSRTPGTLPSAATLNLVRTAL